MTADQSTAPLEIPMPEAETTEREFIIRALLEFEYRVKAEDADEAEQIMNDGELRDKGTCVGYSIDAVVSPDKVGHFWRDEDDLRARCTCGHLVADQHTGHRFGEREPSKSHPMACGSYRCDCLAPVEAVATPEEDLDLAPSPLPLGEKA